MDDYTRISLLEAIVLQYSGEHIPRVRKDEEYAKHLADDIEKKIPAELITTLEWNEVLHLLCGCAPEMTSEAARKKLLNVLRNQDNSSEEKE